MARFSALCGYLAGHGHTAGARAVAEQAIALGIWRHPAQRPTVCVRTSPRGCARSLFGQRVYPVGSDPAIGHRGVPSSLLPPLSGDPPVVRVRKPRCDHEAMPKLRCVCIVAMGLEHAALWPTIHRYEPGSVAEFGASARHRSDLPAISTTLM
jgi:hypothetical protein